jgi:hypothetical protein
MADLADHQPGADHRADGQGRRSHQRKGIPEDVLHDQHIRDAQPKILPPWGVFAKRRPALNSTPWCWGRWGGSFAVVPLWSKWALVAAFALVTAPVAPVRAAGGSFTIGLIGDTGYSSHDDANLLKVRASTNASRLAFVVHDGDILKGDTPCSDARLRYVRGVFNGFSTLIYTPGDNEWQDCPNGHGWLDDIRRTFFSTGNSLGTHPIGQYRQRGTPENARWERGGVIFATVDVPGPNGGGPVAADLAWLDATFDRAAAAKAAGVMVIWQDDPTDNGSSAALVARLKLRAGEFRRPVVLVHGDTHRYRLDHPWKDAPNLTRLETYPGFTPTWVKATVNPASPAVFSFVTIHA